MTYRELFGVPEFRPFFLAAAVNVAAGTLAGLALATLVFARTGSPLLSALSLFGSSLAQLVGALSLLSIADRMPPRATLVAVTSTIAAGTALLALPGLPVWAMLAIILVHGLVGSVAGGTRWGLLAEILPDDAYILGRSVLNMVSGGMQIVGFATGGVLLVVMSAREALLTAATLEVAAALTLRYGLTARAARADGRASVRETWRVNRRLWALPGVRVTYIALWVPNGLVVGCEALFVPYAPHAAGVLFIAGALGMFVGDTVAGRWVPRRWRGRLISPVQAMLAAPYLLFVVVLPVPLAAALVAVASLGFGAGLLLQERLVTLVPGEIRGQALGLHSSGMLTMQAVAATVSGTLAEFVGPGTAMALMACGSLVVTALLVPGLRLREAPVDRGGAGRLQSGVRAAERPRAEEPS